LLSTPGKGDCSGGIERTSPTILTPPPDEPRCRLYQTSLRRDQDASSGLDARTGEIVWEKRRGLQARLLHDPRSAGRARKRDGRGLGWRVRDPRLRQALDAETGKTAWKTFTVPGPGEPAMRPGPKTLANRRRPVWITGSYDPPSDSRTGAPATPRPGSETRAPATPYSSSVIALDVETGRLAAHHQYH
jgi:alcohol dehydrogenase (cytochrome c)